MGDQSAAFSGTVHVAPPEPTVDSNLAPGENEGGVVADSGDVPRDCVMKVI
jgi:hypothetical protein